MSSVDDNTHNATVTTEASSFPSTTSLSSSNDEGCNSNRLEDFVHCFPGSSLSIIPHHTGQSENPTVKVIDALSKFQTCLLILSNTVLRLQETLRQFIPGHSSPQKSTASSEETMPGSIARQFSRKSLSHIDISPENNNVLKEGIVPPVRQRTDVEVNVTDTSHSSSTVTSACQNAINSPMFEFSGVDGGDDKGCQRQLESPKQEAGCFSKMAAFILRYVGIILALFASVCMSLVTLVVKYLEQYHPVSKVIWRLQGVLAPSLVILLYVRFYQRKPLIIWKNSEEPSNHWTFKILILLVIRGLVGCSADIFQYYSLKYLPLADSTVLSFSTPIFVCLVAHFVLKEQCGIVPIVTALITLFGVVVISQPPMFTGREEMSDGVLFGTILGILCMMSATLTTVIMRYLKNVHFAMTMMALGIVGTVEGFIVTLFTSPFELPLKGGYQDLALACLIVGLFFFGQLAQTLALQREEAGIISLVRTCDVLLAFIWQVLLLHQQAPFSSCIGALIVTVGVCITAVRKWISDLPDHNPIRRKLYFILK